MADAGTTPVGDGGTGPTVDARIVPGVDAAVAQPIVIEAEAWDVEASLDVSLGGRHWQRSSAVGGFSGSGYIVAPAGDCELTVVACGCVAQYNFRVTVAGAYRVVLRHAAPSSARDSVWWGIDLGLDHPNAEDLNPEVSADGWIDDVDPPTINLGVGDHDLRLFLRETATPIDQIRLEPI